MTNLSLLSACRQVCRQAALGRRHFWWCRERTWASRLDPQYQKIIDRRYKTLKHRYAHAVERRKLWDREFGQPHWRWHLARCSESRGLASRWVSMNRVSEHKESELPQKPSNSTQDQDQTRSEEKPAGHTRQRPTMEELKKELDENPYGALFGHRAEYLNQSGPWSPHGMWKSFSSKFGAFPYSGESMMSVDHHTRQRASSDANQDDMSGSESWAQPTPGSSQDSISGSYESVSAGTNGYEIDPITLRKVGKSTASSGSDEVFDIPVKKSSGQFVPKSDIKKDVGGSKGTSSSVPQGHDGGNQSPKRSKSKSATNGPVTRGPPAAPRPKDPVASQLENPTTVPTHGKESSDGASSPTWLAREGFGATVAQAPKTVGQPETRIGQATVRSNQAPYISKSHVQSPTQAPIRTAKSPNAEEEGLDQLRPSDVRAAAGIGKGPAERSQQHEIQPSYSPQANQPARNEDVASDGRKAKQLIKEVRQIYEDNYGTIDTSHRQPTMPAKLDSKTGPPSKVPEQTPIVASTAPTAVDVKSVPLKTELVGPDPSERGINSVLSPKESKADSGPPGLVAQTNPTDLESSNPKPVELHWQEQEKILNHDVEEIEDFLSDVDKQLDAVVRERRMRAAAQAESIESKPDPATATQSSAIYKILALDPLTQEISSAVMTSSTAPTSGMAESTTSLAEIIPKLRSPARFLAYIAPLQADGFELVSGGGDALVFKQVREPVQPSPSRAPTATVDVNDLDRRAANAYVNPIDGTTMGNFASPTGFVSYNTTFHSEAEAPSSSIPDISSDATRMSGQGKVTREEPVFSGRQKWQDEPPEAGDGNPSKKGGRMTRRLLWGGAWVAACSYAVGVVTEFLRASSDPVATANRPPVTTMSF